MHLDLLAYFLAFYLANLLALYLTFYLPTWGPAGNTWRGYSRLRSGREHWAWMVVVEVRQGTLGGDGRGWGPAGNTGRWWSWLRSGRAHWAWMVVVEVRQGAGGEETRRGDEERRRGEEEEKEEEEEQATDIKSNNPHLAGGEKHTWTHRTRKTSNHIALLNPLFFERNMFLKVAFFSLLLVSFYQVVYIIFITRNLLVSKRWAFTMYNMPQNIAAFKNAIPFIHVVFFHSSNIFN